MVLEDILQKATLNTRIRKRKEIGFLVIVGVIGALLLVLAALLVTLFTIRLKRETCKQIFDF